MEDYEWLREAGATILPSITLRKGEFMSINEFSIKS
jgi:hypothetical protein